MNKKPILPSGTSAALEAVSVLKSFDVATMPVDVFKLVRSEGIELCPVIVTEDDFSGRIEYHGDLRKFLLFFPDLPLAEQTGRVRFSIAHELGHYFIPHHREMLLAGQEHNSKAGFVCDRKMEREADQFAATLLMPEKPFLKKFKGRGFLTLPEMVTFADEVQVSREALAIRYTELAEEICSVIVSVHDEVCYCATSDDGLYNRFRLSKGASTASLPQPSRTTPFVSEKLSVQTVFPQAFREGEVWVESMNLGYGDRIITMISTV